MHEDKREHEEDAKEEADEHEKIGEKPRKQ